jgi:hemerythrin-like domain-containing protein
VKPPCGVKRLRLCCPKALRSRKRRRDSRFHYLYGYEACTELETHAQLEEQIFYPAVNEETEDGQELVQEAIQEHQTVKDLIAALREMGPDNKEFDAKFHELIHKVEHHVEEEESAMFPLAEDELEEDMQDLKNEMQELKEQILAS